MFIKALFRVSNYQPKMVSSPYSKHLSPLEYDSGIRKYLIDHNLVKTLSCKTKTVRLLTVPVIVEMLADKPYSCRGCFCGSNNLILPKGMMFPWRCIEMVGPSHMEFSKLQLNFFLGKELNPFRRFPNLPVEI